MDASEVVDVDFHGNVPMPNPTSKALAYDEWLQTVRTVCGPMDAARSGHDFLGYVGERRVADILMLRHEAGVQSLYWDERHIQEIQTPYLYVIMQRSPNALSIEQGGVEIVLQSGDWTLIDSLKPARFEFQDRFDIIAFNLPRDLAVSRSWKADLAAPRVFSGSEGDTAVFGAYARALFAHAPGLGAGKVHHRETFLDLLFEAIPPEWDAHGRTSDRRAHKALRYIDENLRDPDLTPVKIAAGSAVSLRHLHRLFAEMGHSVGDVIRERRLVRARADLSDHRFARNSVLDIALSWGFNDGAHFSRAFRAAFGVSPRDYRASQSPRLG